YGYPRERLLSLNISDLNVLSPADIEQEMVEANRQGRGYLRLPHRLSSGETRQVEVHEGPVDGPRGSLLYCVVHDVSGWVEAEKRLRQAAAVFETSDEGVMITDADLRILSVNHAFSQITGYTEDEVIGRTPEFLGAGVHDKHFFRRILGELAGSGRWQGDVWNRRKSGEVCPEWLSLSAVEGADSTVENYIWVFADVSDIKRTRTKLEYIAHHDPLTDLPNRLLFNTRLKHALDRAQRGVNQLAVLLLDLDRFKNINDSFGHPVGDLLLSMAAGRMQSCLRREDTMARIGGDEFAVLLEGIDDGKAAARVADKLIQALAPSFHLKGVETFITASIGIAVYPLDGQTSTKLMRNADAALFVAKGEGRNTFRYYRREMTADVRERLTMEAALRRAIDNDEFEVWYQPQVNR
ncbi:MAG: diguanylate cyclase, partial [gamma proteobacterium symbiont of Phacoides pectinatus]